MSEHIAPGPGAERLDRGALPGGALYHLVEITSGSRRPRPARSRKFDQSSFFPSIPIARKSSSAKRVSGEYASGPPSSFSHVTRSVATASAGSRGFRDGEAVHQQLERPHVVRDRLCDLEERRAELRASFLPLRPARDLPPEHCERELVVHVDAKEVDIGYEVSTETPLGSFAACECASGPGIS